MKIQSDLIEIDKIVEHKDGTATMHYELTKEGAKVFRKLAKKQKKVCNNEFVNQTILDCIKEAMENDKNKVL